MYGTAASAISLGLKGSLAALLSVMVVNQFQGKVHVNRVSKKTNLPDVSENGF